MFIEDAGFYFLVIRNIDDEELVRIATDNENRYLMIEAKLL